MKVTVLGCGGAGGVPLIGHVWGACDPREPRNRRRRVSLFVDGGQAGERLLFDTSPDMREQLLDADIRDVSAIFYTHAHADHAHGIDNIRSLNWLLNRAIPLYADRATLDELTELFPYIFKDPPPAGRFYKPVLETHLLKDGETLSFGRLSVTSFHQTHGTSHSRGYRVGDLGYCTDVSALSEAAFEVLKGIKVWILAAIREKPHPAHANLEEILSWVERVGPARVYLTHMDHTVDYATLKAQLPRGVEPAYDGLEIECC